MGAEAKHSQWLQDRLAQEEALNNSRGGNHPGGQSLGRHTLCVEGDLEIASVQTSLASYTATGLGRTATSLGSLCHWFPSLAVPQTHLKSF